MLGCAAQCAREWFHPRCVPNLTMAQAMAIPADAPWWCPDCQPAQSGTENDEVEGDQAYDSDSDGPIQGLAL